MVNTTAVDTTTIVGALHTLIQACHKSQKGYTEAAREASSADLTIKLNRLATERAQAVTDLQQFLLQLGIFSRTNGALPNMAWHSRLGGEESILRSDPGILRRRIIELCEQEDRSAQEQYEHILALDLPDELNEMVDKQHREIVAALESIDTWKR